MDKELKTGFPEIRKERLYYQGSDPWYLEIAITGKCNFSCKYCNRFNQDVNVELLESFLTHYGKTKHIQLTGGEPFVHSEIDKILYLCRDHTEKLGISTNGSFPLSVYQNSGATRFSISLDDYDNTVLAERGYKNPEHIKSVIKELAKNFYVDVGLVVDSVNINRLESIIDYILNLGVSDIKLSVSTKDIDVLPRFSKTYEKYPILSYRVSNFNSGRKMRGYPSKTCGIAKNDVTIVGDKHYPCLVYFREGGQSIGDVSKNLMEERVLWSSLHNSLQDPICSKFCMDFKCDFNRALEKLSATLDK